MAQVTYPGVYVNEKKGAPSPIQGVSSSTLGIAGWTTKGPHHEATLVSSWGQFVDRFGTFTADGLVPLSLYTFLKNGGSKAYVVRTTPDDAVESSLYVKNAGAEENIEVGDGATTQFSGTLTGKPVPSTLSITYYGDGAETEDEEIEDGNEANGIIVLWKTVGSDDGEGAVLPFASLPVKPGSVTINWVNAADVAKSQTDSTGEWAGDGAPANTTFDYVNGLLELDTTGAPVKTGTTITVTYRQLIERTITDDGLGSLEGDVDDGGTNTIDYDTGAYSFKTSSTIETHESLGIVSSAYTEALWRIVMLWPGASGDNVRVKISGNPNYENIGLGTFSRYDVIVEEYDASKAKWNQKESFKAMSFTDSDDADYFPNVVNDEDNGSALIEVQTPSFDDSVPTTLSGTAVSGEVLVDGSDGSTEVTGTLAEASCVKYSVTITATAADSSELSITDDGSGNLIGDVDSSGDNTIDYDTGVYAFTLSTAPLADSDVTIDYVKQPAETTYTVTMAGGDDGSAVSSSDVTSASLEADGKGIFAFNAIEDNLLIVVPDFAGDETVDGAIVDFCEDKGDRFAILATPSGMTVQQAVNYKKNTLNKLSTYAAIYWPWIRVIDPVTEKSKTVPPIGHVAGVYARTISNKNVSKAPAGKEDGQLAYLLGLESNALDGEVGTANDVGLNAIIKRTRIGTAVWGARTLDVNDEYKYIQARMLYMYLSKSIYNAMHWVPFENNGPQLWTRIKLQLESFMKNLFNNNYFAGKTEDEAFFIVVDGTNNPQESIDQGVVNIDVGFAPHKPAEFVVFNLSQKTA